VKHERSVARGDVRKMFLDVVQLAIDACRRNQRDVGRDGVGERVTEGCPVALQLAGPRLGDRNRDTPIVVISETLVAQWWP